MNNNLKKTVIALAVVLCVTMAGCSKEDEETVTSPVTITPASASVFKGETPQFTASPQSVEWSIVESEINAGTTIDTSGLLTVAAAETLPALTVMAALTDDTTKFGRANVTVTEWSFNGETFTRDTIKKVNGYDFELWNQNSKGTVNMTLGEGGTFKCDWSGIENVLFRAGKKYNQTQTHSEIGDISIEYNVRNYTFTGSVSYLSVYGWVTGGSPDSLIEYYIVEKRGSYNPGSSGLGSVRHGTVTIDGGTYTIYETTRTNQPSILGTRTFKQYWSIRSQSRTSGTISVSEHFKAWADKGLTSIDNGKMYEVALKIEGYQNTGSAEITKNIYKVNGVPIPTP